MIDNSTQSVVWTTYLSPTPNAHGIPFTTCSSELFEDS
jgi:hypothetical protein